MGLFDTLKKKFEKSGEKKVRNIVDEKKSEKKKESHKGSLSKEDIKRAQALEVGGKAVPDAKGKEKKKVKEGPRDTKRAHHVLLKPAFTEKNALHATNSTYVFHVHPGTTKSEVKKAVFAVYGIVPVAIRVINSNPKEVTFGRITGKLKEYKKAFVTLPKGKTIDVYQS